MGSMANGKSLSVVKEIIKKENLGDCRICSQQTELICKRCGDFYCSKKCQYIDWPNHRYICFPKPPLVKETLLSDEEVFPIQSPGVTENYACALEEIQVMLKTIIKKLYDDDCIPSSLKSKLINSNTSSSNSSDSFNDTATTVIDRTINNVPEVCKIAENTTNDGSQASQNTAIPEMTFGENELIVLCCFRSTNRCVIRSAEAETAVRTITEQVDKYGRNNIPSPMETIPKVGTYAMTLKSNKQFTRVQVLTTKNANKIRVIFCDYGNTVMRTLSELYPIADEIANLPKHLVTVQLHNVHVHQYTKSILDYLKTFERREYRLKYIQNNGNTDVVQLYDIVNDQLINEMVSKYCAEHCSSEDLSTNVRKSFKRQLRSENELKCQSESTSMVEPVNEHVIIPVVMKAPFETHLFKTDMSKFKVIVVDVNLIEYGYMACVDEKHIRYLSKIQQLLQNMDMEDAPPYKPKMHEYCLAQYENAWYRGYVVGLHDDGKFEISYIDFLNEAILTSADIRPYPHDLKIDCYTTLCKIDNLPKKLNDKHRRFLKSKVKINDTIYIERIVQIIEEKIALIECGDIVAGIDDANITIK